MALRDPEPVEPTPGELFRKATITKEAHHATDEALVFEGDAEQILRFLAKEGLQVDCIVTSPPFYGQRDYEVEGQIGLESHPDEYLKRLWNLFEVSRKVLKPTGSLWVNLGDTYWSGRGQHKSSEKKQSARRFGLRPQDRKGDGAWCRPKQLLLIPHRFAIGMQERGWIVRNDNVWVKPNPIPDQVADRCSSSHEYVFHFVTERFYYFDRTDVGRPGNSDNILPPLDTWEVPTTRGNGVHKAMFSNELIRTPILASCPPRGVVLDPMAGAGTTLSFALRNNRRAIGIDIKREFCELMADEVEAAESQAKIEI